MTLSELRILAIKNGLKMKDIAALMGISKQALYQKLKANRDNIVWSQRCQDVLAKLGETDNATRAKD